VKLPSELPSGGSGYECSTEENVKLREFAAKLL
jgi:hypothetical protein